MSVSYTNYKEEADYQNKTVLLISIFLYGFITVITLIGVTNIFNTITTNMNLRSKEFAMLKSIGMTKKEFNKMINLESIFYGVKSLIIGIALGTGISYWIYRISAGSDVTSILFCPIEGRIFLLFSWEEDTIFPFDLGVSLYGCTFIIFIANN